MPEIPREYLGWWRIVETSQWVNDDIDICGTALISLTGRADRLRMFVLLAYMKCKPTKAGVSFTWEGAWEFDPVSGTGSVKLGRDGRLKGKLKIKDGDESTFIAGSAPLARRPDGPCALTSEDAASEQFVRLFDPSKSRKGSGEGARASGEETQKSARP